MGVIIDCVRLTGRAANIKVPEAGLQAFSYAIVASAQVTDSLTLPDFDPETLDCLFGDDNVPFGETQWSFGE